MDDVSDEGTTVVSLGMARSIEAPKRLAAHPNTERIIRVTRPLHRAGSRAVWARFGDVIIGWVRRAPSKPPVGP